MQQKSPLNIYGLNQYAVWTVGNIGATKYSEYRGIASGPDFPSAFKKMMQEKNYREYEYNEIENTLYGDKVIYKEPMHVKLRRLGL